LRAGKPRGDFRRDTRARRCLFFVQDENLHDYSALVIEIRRIFAARARGRAETKQFARRIRETVVNMRTEGGLP
tara:strand:+ start:134 stop:355 length:222 start_codon:yes stop_codon:yes gene_type:complete